MGGINNSDSQDESTPKPALIELSGTVLEGRYEVGRALGAGGMGAVFEARHLRLDRRVAIKVLRKVFVAEHSYNKRFLREAKAASKIRHRNVVEILDYGETENGLTYSVMEFLEGQDLKQLLAEQPDERLPWHRAFGLLVQVASGLKAAHGCGVIHRDIKPANCVLTQEDGETVVKVVDFGIAKVSDTDQSQQITGTSQMLGTPAYIAPELAKTKNPADARSDIYSLGVLAYRMLTGQVPFVGDTTFAVLAKSCFDDPRPLRQLVPELPESVDDFVLQLLAKDPEQRPPDMQAVRQGLIEIAHATIEPQIVAAAGSSAIPLNLDASGESWPPSKSSPRSEALTLPREEAETTAREQPSPRRRGGPWIAGLAIAAVAGGLALWSSVGREHGEPSTSPSPSSVVAVDDTDPQGHSDQDRPPDQSAAGTQTEASPMLEASTDTTGADESSGGASTESGDAEQVEPATSQRSQSSGPPTDREVRYKLKRRIKSRCGKKLGGQSVLVSFAINPDGQTVMITDSVGGEAGACVTKQVARTKFRPRDKLTGMKFTVK